MLEVLAAEMRKRVGAGLERLIAVLVMKRLAKFIDSDARGTCLRRMVTREHATRSPDSELQRTDRDRAACGGDRRGGRRAAHDRRTAEVRLLKMDGVHFTEYGYRSSDFAWRVRSRR
jgi:hypothetical protein